jgi:hypothetical protein
VGLTNGTPLPRLACEALGKHIEPGSLIQSAMASCIRTLSPIAKIFKTIMYVTRH